MSGAGEAELGDESLGAAEESASERAPLPLVFKGNAREYFRLWVVNLCLTLLTFGIFSAWAKVRRKRYFYSHTELAGVPFEYLGAPLPILKGRLIAAVLLGLWYVGTHGSPRLLLVVFGVGVVLAPWVMVRSATFNARYSAYRNIAFDFSGSYKTAASALLVSMLLTVVTCGLGYPWALTHLRRGGRAHEGTRRAGPLAETPARRRVRSGKPSGPEPRLEFRDAPGIGPNAFALSLPVSGVPLLLAEARYSQEFELEADRAGYALSAQAGFSPELFASCLRRLAKKREGMDPAPGYLSRHPPNAERIARAHAAALDFERKRPHPTPPASASP